MDKYAHFQYKSPFLSLVVPKGLTFCHIQHLKSYHVLVSFRAIFVQRLEM